MGISIKSDRFGEIVNNGETEEVVRYTVSNGSIEVQLITYGATITSLKVPGKNGEIEDIVLGFDDISSYIDHTHYFGSTIGRYANRIAGGEFVLDDKKYLLAKNNGPNHLHGGIKGFDKVLWSSEIQNNKIIFYYTSPSMEENYPGDLECKVIYELKEDNELVINYEATTNHPTPVNLTNHSYFNLAGHGKEAIYNHVIFINADSYTPVDKSLIPTGKIASVASTKLDFRKPKQIGTVLNSNMEGFDHNFCVNGQIGEERKVAYVFHPESGRGMEIYSDQPGVQFYTSNGLPEDYSLSGKDGRYYHKHGAFCLETQNYPNAVNQPNFPTAILDVNEVYNHVIRFCFRIEDVKS